MSEMQNIIVGAGLAGLYCALNLLPEKSTIIALDAIGVNGSSEKAQGGIAAAIGKDDSPELHQKDTERAGNGIVDPYAAQYLTRSAKAQIEQLIDIGVEFDKDAKGDFLLNQEAAHSRRRVVKAKGDFSGREVMEKLSNAVRCEPNITLIEHHQLLDFLPDQNQLLLQDLKHNRLTQIKCDRLILATGGIGGLYQNSTNPPKMCGDGLAVAYKMGAQLSNLEFVQFHPTALNKHISPTPLLTEAIRGDGAKLVNDEGHYFMRDYHEKAELAPRDIVSRAVFDQIRLGHFVFLDAREAIGAEFATRFPQSYEICKQNNIDPAHDLIPITPAQHYHMGGIKVDQHGRTNVKGLYACGEVSYTGVHGANRLASNSLIEALVYAKSITETIKTSDEQLADNRFLEVPQLNAPFSFEGDESCNLLKYLRQMMDQHVGLIRNQQGLQLAHMQIKEWQLAYQNEYPICNHLLTAKLIVEAALARRESRGSHYREDFKNLNQSKKQASISQQVSA